MRWLALLLLVLSPAAARAADLSLEGTVFSDRDGDGVFSVGDAPLAGVVVGWETLSFARTDAQGRYHLSVPYPGIVWARAPGSHSPTPVWRNAVVSGTYDLPLAPAGGGGPLVFVQASDLHVGITDGEQIARAFRQATEMEPRPAFLVVTGDLTNDSYPEEFDVLDRALGQLGVPFVPVSGNHDTYDGGAEYRSRFGPPSYSFDSGGAHFLVLDYAADEAAIVHFVRRELAMSPPRGPVVAFMHGPPSDRLAAELAELGVAYLFTGHYHANRVLAHGRLTELNTEPMYFGGIDFTPAGWRVASLGEDGQLHVRNQTFTDRPVLTLAAPRPGHCASPGPVRFIASVQLGGAPAEVRLSIDGETPAPLEAAGGWTYAGARELAPGLHRYRLEARGLPAGPLVEEGTICARVERGQRRARPLLDWPQLGGSPAHEGRSPVELAPPLRVVWSHPVGGNLRGGSPVLADGKLFVPVVDLDEGSRGGVVALDAETGEVVWEDRPGPSVNNSPAVEDGIVVTIGDDGMVQGDEAATGRALWSADVRGPEARLSFTYSAPAISDGRVYVGSNRKFAALDLASGAELWSLDPEPRDFAGAGAGTYAAAAVGDGIVVGVFGLGREGVIAWDVEDGHERWRIPPPASTTAMASPLLADGVVYLVNVESQVTAIDAQRGTVRWTHKLYDLGGIDWGYGPLGTPALADGRLFVPTPRDYLYAVDDRGRDLWRVGAGASVIHPVKYLSEGARAYLAAPAVAGDTVWVGAADGVLRGIDAKDGRVRFQLDLGAPILSGVVPAGDRLFVATFDGTVRALEPAPPAHVESAGGCAVAAPRGGVGGLFVLSLLLARTILRRYRGRSCPRRRGRRPC